MKIQSFSIVAGGTTCNARCPFCVARMTPQNGVPKTAPAINFRRFEKAARFAQINDVSTVLITSKGEATLFPENITTILAELKKFQFPIIELQTNGEKLLSLAEDGTLTQWANGGLTTIALSIVHYDPEKNRKVYFPSRKAYFDLPATIAKMRELGFSVRLSTIMLEDHIDSVAELDKLVDFALTNKVEHLTIRPVTVVQASSDPAVAEWTSQHLPKNEAEIHAHLKAHGRPLLKLMHGGTVYDYRGQNLCTYTCLTHEPDSGELRQIIYFPDGTLRYDWVSPAAIIF